MTDREREFAGLGFEYAEGLDRASIVIVPSTGRNKQSGSEYASAAISREPKPGGFRAIIKCGLAAGENVMARYRMDDGTVVDTTKATAKWDETTRWDGHNHISNATGSQWEHQTLHKSRKGRYYVEHVSQWQGSRPHVEWISPEEATRWLLANEHDELPEELQKYVDEVME